MVVTVEFMDGVTRTYDADSTRYADGQLVVMKAEYYGSSPKTTHVVPLHNVREVRFS